MLFGNRAPKLGKCYQTGEIIAREGEVASHLHIVQSGMAEVYRTGFEGDRIRLTLLKAGDMFGIMALFDRQPFHSSIQALEETWVLLIDKRSILRRVYEDPSLVLRILENLTARIMRQDDEILALTNAQRAAMGGLAELAATLGEGGSNRLSRLVMGICERLRAANDFPEWIDAGFLNDMRVATLFYDIGNAGLPAGLLTRGGALSPQEREVLKTHIHIGSDLLTQTAGRTGEGRGGHFRLAAELARCHHERYDGSGYLGLKGEEIPLGARIVAVADVFIALRTERAHRKPLGEAEAVAFILERSGSQFDPRVVKAFAAVVSQSV